MTRRTGITRAEANTYVPSFGAKTGIDPRIPEIEETVVKYPIFMDGLAKMANVHSLRKGMILEGETGLGKTTIIKSYYKEVQKLLESKSTDVLTPHPVLLIKVPARPTMARLLNRMFDEFNTKAKLSSKLVPAEKQVSDLIISHQVSLIIFDEYQHLLRGEHYTKDTFNNIKIMMDDHDVGLILAGLPKGRAALENHGELKERLGYQHLELKPFNLNSKKHKAMFKGYLGALREKIKSVGGQCIPFDSNEGVVLERVLLATYGKARLIRNLISHSLTASGDRFTLDADTLAKGYDNMEGSRNQNLNGKNPFKMSDELVLQSLTQKHHIEQAPEPLYPRGRR